MGSDIRATRQGVFTGGGVDVEIEEPAADFKAVILQNITDGIIFIKTKMDKNGDCTKVKNDAATQITRETDSILLETSSSGTGKITVKAAVAVADKEFTWLALVT